MSPLHRSLSSLSRRALCLSLCLTLVVGGTPSAVVDGGQGQSGRAAQVGG